jgi:hypothetical protein
MASPIGHRQRKISVAVRAIPLVFGRERHVMRELWKYPKWRPIALEIVADILPLRRVIA